MARASGVWSPLNIVVSLFWGATIFDEFLNTATDGLIVLAASVAAVDPGERLPYTGAVEVDPYDNSRRPEPC